MIDLALADHRLIDSSDVLGAGYGGYLHGELQADFAVIGMDSWSHIENDAHVDVRELRVYQRIHDASARSRCAHPHACLEASGSYRNAVPNAQLGVLAVDHTNLRIIDDSGLTIGEQGRCRGAGQRDAVIGCPDRPQLI